MSTPDGGPAFPSTEFVRQVGENSYCTHPVSGGGMTLRQYAAIKLRVPNSGVDWLDDMIEESRRQDFAAAALQGLCACVEVNGKREDMAKWAYEHADAMPAESAKGGAS